MASPPKVGPSRTSTMKSEQNYETLYSRIHRPPTRDNFTTTDYQYQEKG